MKKAKRILVGLKEEKHAVELVDLACRAGSRGASLRLIHVIELPDVTPLDADVPDLEAEARKILRLGERVARRSRMKVTSEVFRARSAGTAVLEEIKDTKSDLAVLGYHHRKTLGEVLLGSTAKHIADRAPCHVLISVPPRD